MESSCQSQLDGLPLQFMLALLDRNPDIYLDEIQEQLGDQHGIEISLATIWRTLKRLGITSKKVSIPKDLRRATPLTQLFCSSQGLLQNAVQKLGSILH